MTACWIYAGLGALVPCLVFAALLGRMLWVERLKPDPLNDLNRKRVGS